MKEEIKVNPFIPPFLIFSLAAEIAFIHTIINQQ